MGIARRGKAALTICSTAFTTMGHAQAAKLGFAALPIVMVPHPFGLQARADVRRIAESCARDIAQLAAQRSAG